MFDLEKAKELINEYCMNEFRHKADFSNMENIGVAYTTLTDYEIPIQVSVDLVHMQLKTWIGTDIISDDMKPDDIRDIETEDLEWLDFDDLISGWEFYIEDNIEKYI